MISALQGQEWIMLFSSRVCLRLEPVSEMRGTTFDGPDFDRMSNGISCGFIESLVASKLLYEALTYNYLVADAMHAVVTIVVPGILASEAFWTFWVERRHSRQRSPRRTGFDHCVQGMRWYGELLSSSRRQCRHAPGESYCGGRKYRWREAAAEKK